MTIKGHLPANHRHWLDRGPGWYRKRANHISAEVGRLIDCILSSKTYPEQTYRSCDGILGLHRKVGSEQLTEAARIALERDCCSYSFINVCGRPTTSLPGSGCLLAHGEERR